MKPPVDILMDRFAGVLAQRGYDITPADNSLLAQAAESKIATPLPPSYRSLLCRYRFTAFEASSLWFFANTDEHTDEQWQSAIFRDEHLSQTLLSKGYVQFAQPDTGSYDPVCFDTTHSGRDGECPIVWIDHEGILCHDKIIVYKEVAPSFVDVVQDYLSGGVA